MRSVAIVRNSDPANQITVESLNDGRSRVLAQFPAGKRSLLVVQGPDGRCGLVTVLTDATGFIERIVGCFAFSPYRLEQLAAVLRDACAALDDS